MGPLEFRRHLFTEGFHGFLTSDYRAGRNRRANLSIPTSGHRIGSPLPGRTPRLQTRSPTPGANRVRGPRSGAQDRRQGPRNRSGGAEKRGYQGSSLSCPHCHESARFVSYRPKTVQSLVGTFPLMRAYYHCPRCGHGVVPWDETLGLDRQALTPGISEVICIAGAVDSFGEASTVVLRKLASVSVSESTVQRTSEAVGQDIGARLAAGETFGASQPWHWHKDAEGKTCAYVSLDLTGLGMQGPQAAAAPGRMTAVGMVYNPVPEQRSQWANPTGAPPRFQARYVAGLEGQAALAEPLRKQAAQVGMDQAQRWIALCDAGSGLEDLLAVNFPRVEAVILDFYHPTEYLGDLGRA